MRTRTELGQLHLSGAIRPRADYPQVIGKTVRRLAPRARFELATLRLTAEMIENLTALSGVAYGNLGAIFPSLVAPTPAPTGGYPSPLPQAFALASRISALQKYLVTWPKFLQKLQRFLLD